MLPPEIFSSQAIQQSRGEFSLLRCCLVFTNIFICKEIFKTDQVNPILDDETPVASAEIRTGEKPKKALKLSKSLGESFSSEKLAPLEFEANSRNEKFGEFGGEFKPEKPQRKSITEGVNEK